MRRLALGILVALIAAACSDGGSPAVAVSASPSPFPPTPAPTSSPSASPAATHLPGTSVRITVNGGELRPGATGVLADAGTTVVVLAFPVAMERASVEQLLPRGDVPTWTDDKTLSLSIAASETNAGFKVPESRSKDGATVIDIFFVPLEHGPSVVASFFTVAELLNGARPPKADAVRVPIGRGHVAIASPDGAKLLTYLYNGPALDPQVVEIAARKSIAVSVPSTPGPLIVAGWAANDRIVFVGSSVWVSDVDGSATRAVADIRVLGDPTAAAVSPSGSFVVVGSTNGVAVVDLGTGAIKTFAGHRACGLGPLTGRAAWSKDERRVALVECFVDAPTVTQIIDVATARNVAGVAGGIYGMVTALNGDLLVSRDSSEHGEGARQLWVQVSFDGVEKARHLARAPGLSLDGRYLTDPSCCAGEGFALRDLQAAPGAADVNIQGSAQWLRDGRVLVLQH